MPNDTDSTFPSACTLYRGDCLGIMPTLAPNVVAMVFADLPYSHKNKKVTQNHWDKEIDLTAFWAATTAPARQNAVFVLTATQPFTSHAVLSNLKYFRYDVVWQKSNITGFFSAKYAPLRSHETLLFYYQKKPTYNAQMTPVTSENAYRPKTIYKSTSRSKNYGGNGLQPHRPDLGMRHPRSVIKINSEARQNSLHETQKPVALLEWLIKTYTNEGDTVLDPVFGSCTTGVACARLGRNFIGIEKDEKYFRIGAERVNKERAVLGLGDATLVCPQLGEETGSEGSADASSAAAGLVSPD